MTRSQGAARVGLVVAAVAWAVVALAAVPARAVPMHPDVVAPHAAAGERVQAWGDAVALHAGRPFGWLQPGRGSLDVAADTVFGAPGLDRSPAHDSHDFWLHAGFPPSFVELPFGHFDQHQRGGRHQGHLDRDGLPAHWHETQAHRPAHVSGPGTVIFLGAGLLLLGLLMRRRLPR